MNHSEDPKLSIIIPVLQLHRPLNKKRFFMPRQTLSETFDNLKAVLTKSYEVIVVCNGQDLDLIEYVKTHPLVNYYCLNSVNVGVSRAWNMGAQMAQGQYLCFLNDDVLVSAGALESLVAQMEEDSSIGEIGPHGSYWQNCNSSRILELDKVADVDVVSGFCFIVKHSLFQQLGGFDIAYTPAGYEETDFSYRVRQAGYRCVADTRVPIKHFYHHGVSSQKIEIQYLDKSIDTESLDARNKAYFKAKWGCTPF
jgi:GT2 family glycosyltransferase